MLPVLLTLGPIPISSFGLFLSLGFIYGSFLIWRLSRAWELNEEKILDLILLTFFGGLVGARLFFVSLNFEFFSHDILKILLITKYPGMNFWGGLLGGWLSLFLFTRRFKLNFLQIADLAAVGFIGGLILGDLGCFLGGCSIGKASNFFFAAPVVGALGKRFPVQVLEGLMSIYLLWRLWPMASHFHFPGKVVSLTLIYLGIIKFITESFRAFHSGGYFLSAIIFILGVYLYYSAGKKSIRRDLLDWFHFTTGLFTSTQGWKLILVWVFKNWYNFKVSWTWKFKGLAKFLRRVRVKPTPKDI